VRSKWNPVGAGLTWVIRGYQKVISPALPQSCKYYPSCSQYAIDALRLFGVWRGLVLSAWRLLRCNPLSHGGYDPVERQRLFVPRARGGMSSGRTGEDMTSCPGSRPGSPPGRVAGC
jgi:putative membrane protein insertion efficiency factor